MKCTVIIWRSWVRTLVGSNLGYIVLLSKLYLIQKISIGSASVYLRTRAFKITSGLSDNVAVHFALKSLMAKWLVQASQWHEIYCHDYEFECRRVELGYVVLLYNSYLIIKFQCKKKHSHLRRSQMHLGPGKLVDPGRLRWSTRGSFN